MPFQKHPHLTALFQTFLELLYGTLHDEQLAFKQRHGFCGAIRKGMAAVLVKA